MPDRAKSCIDGLSLAASAAARSRVFGQRLGNAGKNRPLHPIIADQKMRSILRNGTRLRGPRSCRRFGVAVFEACCTVCSRLTAVLILAV